MKVVRRQRLSTNVRGRVPPPRLRSSFVTSVDARVVSVDARVVNVDPRVIRVDPRRNWVRVVA